MPCREVLWRSCGGIEFEQGCSSIGFCFSPMRFFFFFLERNGAHVLTLRKVVIEPLYERFAQFCVAGPLGRYIFPSKWREVERDAHVCDTLEAF